jgi:hypothetical protein
MTVVELRIYTTLPGRLPNLLSRFENHTLRIWEKHGIRQIGFWFVPPPFSSLPDWLPLNSYAWCGVDKRTPCCVVVADA